MDAEPLNLVRPEVPVELAALVAKMMAKEPDQRFQTPGAVAQALIPFFKPTATTLLASSAPASGVGIAPAPPESGGRDSCLGRTFAIEAGNEGVAWERLIDTKQSAEASIRRRRNWRKNRNRRPPTSPAHRPPWMSPPAVAGAAAIVLLALGAVIWMATNNGSSKIAVDSRPHCRRPRSRPPHRRLPETTAPKGSPKRGVDSLADVSVKKLSRRLPPNETASYPFSTART